MKILYFADSYGHNIMSLKRIIREELERRGIDVVYQDKSAIGNVLGLVEAMKPDQVWLVHSALTLPCDKELVGAPVIGFGFSDPHYFTPARLKSYDAYITAHYGTYTQYKETMPVLYSPDTYTPDFYHGLGLERDIDASCIGGAIHSRFSNTRERIEVIDKLRTDTNFNIHTFGDGWPPHPNNHSYVSGNELVSVINRSKVGLDIQGGAYSLSERVFHYSGCGTPIITYGCVDTDRAFVRGKEILTYNSYTELKDKLVHYLGATGELEQIGRMAQERCLREHTVANRVGTMLDFTQGAKK